MVAEMTCYTYLGHIRNPRIYAVSPPPPNYAVFTRFYFHPKNRVKWGGILYEKSLSGENPCRENPSDGHLYSKMAHAKFTYHQPYKTLTQ